MDYKSSKSKDNAFFEKFGQTPPELNIHLTEEEREKYRKQALEGHVCKYYQMGNRIICEEGENEHGRIIPINKMLVETKNGVPVFTEFTISS